MRIISQDGTIDIPYEQVTVQRFRENIYLLNKNLTSIELFVNSMVIASYSTKEKAQKAMKMLQDKYTSRMELDGGYDEVHNCYVQPNFWVLPKIFQFPKDEDVEV